MKITWQPTLGDMDYYHVKNMTECFLEWKLVSTTRLLTWNFVATVQAKKGEAVQLRDQDLLRECRSRNYTHRLESLLQIPISSDASEIQYESKFHLKIMASVI